MDNKKKDSNPKSQIIISILILTIIIITEMYLMINYNESYILIIGLGVCALVSVYVMANSALKMFEEQEVKRETQYEKILRSEKASYIMLKKNFEKIEEKLESLQSDQQPLEEIINAQKAMAKTIIKKTKEEIENVAGLNSEFATQMNVELKDLAVQIRDVDTELQDLVLQMKEMEQNLNQKIVENTKVVVQAVPAEAVEEELPDVEEVKKEKAMLIDENHPLATISAEVKKEIAAAEEEAVVEVSDPNKMMSPDDIAALLESMGGEAETEVPQEKTAEEVKAPELDLSDPNKMMSPEDIAALLASMENESQPESEPVVEKTPEPDLSDPNKMMSADDIAALFASMAGGDAQPEETVAIEQEIAATEEKPPMPDMSDPNKMMSPEDIAALIANL